MDKKEIIKYVFKKGFWAVLCVVGVILICAGLFEHAKIPEAYYCGGGIFVFSAICYFIDLIIQGKKEIKKNIKK